MRREAKIEEQTIPMVHSNIDLADIKANGKLIDDKEIPEIIRKMEVRGSNTRDYEQGEVVLVNGKYYATYDKAPLGEGGFGQVVIAQDLHDKDNMVAIKRQRFFNDRKKDEIVHAEQNILAKAQLSPGSLAVKNKHFIVMKLGTGIQLASLAESQRIIPTIRLLKIASNTLDAIEELHSNNLVHRDIKGANLLVDLITERVTPIDLGFALEVKGDAAVVASDWGTPGYMAPECYPPTQLFSRKSDVYALGKTLGRLFGIVQPKPPNTPGDSLVILDKDNPLYVNNTLIPDVTVRDLMRQLIVNMTHVDIAQRFTLAQAKTTLKAIIDNHLLLPTKIMNVGLLDVDEYKRSSLDQRYYMVLALKNCDEVLLLDKTQPQVSSQDLLVMRRDLESNNVNVGHKVFKTDTIKNVITQIPEHINCQQADRINNYFLITGDIKLSDSVKAKNNKICPLIVAAQKTSVDYQKEMLEHLLTTKIDPQHIAIVKKSLKEELVRLENKYGASKEKLTIGKQRIILIENYLERMKDGLTYAGLIGSLETLQQRMTATGGFSRLFGKKSTGAERIESLRVDIHTKVKDETGGRFKRK
jgi:serine/threonine protein kinase